MIPAKVGQIIIKKEWTGELIRVRIEELHRNVKNGQPGFDGTVVDANDQPVIDKWSGEPRMTWGYDDQIVRVVK